MDVVDAEIVEEGASPPTAQEPQSNPAQPVQPTRLSQSSIGGLKIRKPAEAMTYLNMMVYGDSGVGKTLLAGTAAFVPELSPVIFLDVEGGTLTLSHFDSTADMDVVRISEWARMQNIYDELREGKHPYKTTIIDSATEMQKLAMNTVLGAGTEILDVGRTPEFKDWNINTEQMRRLIRAFRDLPMNTIVTALAMDSPNTRNPALEIRKPSFSKKLANEIPGFFDLVWYMYTKEIANGPNARLLCTDKTDRVVAKCRVSGVPQILQNPTMEKIYDMIIRNPQPLDFGSLEVVDVAQSGGSMKKKSTAKPK